MRDGSYWERLRDVSVRELRAATLGRAAWIRFVQESERYLGHPWSVIREDLNRLHKIEGAP